MGNPTSYLGKTLTWEGKQLKTISQAIGNTSISYSFEYDENGLRTSKTAAIASIGTTQTTSYYYNGTVLIGMEGLMCSMRFSYDASGHVVSVNYNGTEYYYVRNAQNDVVKLIDNNGNTVVEYLYDTWGKLLSVSGTLATSLGYDQPFRYRGYVYDNDTGWYYLQSRYYDPATCRFISADIYLSTGQGVIGHNAFAYCGNNPIVRSDPSGCNWWDDFVDWVEGAAEDVANWATNTFGFESQVEFSHESIKVATIFGDFESGESASTACGDSSDKPIVFYYKAASEWWKVWEYSAGVKVNVVNGGGAIEIGAAHTDLSISAGGTTFTFNGGVDRLGYTLANEVDWKNNTAGHYTQYYIRPLTVVPAAIGVAAAVCYGGPAAIAALAALLTESVALMPA